MAKKEKLYLQESLQIHEEFLRMTLKEAKEYYEANDIKGEFVILVEGKKPDNNKKISEESIEDLMKKYLAEGIDKKEAMKKVAKDKGISKSDVYKRLISCFK